MSCDARNHRWALSCEHSGTGSNTGPIHAVCWARSFVSLPALSPFPGFPAPTPKRSVRFYSWPLILSAATNSRLARLLCPHALSLPAVCPVAGKLLLLVFLSFPSLVPFSQTYPLPAFIGYSSAVVGLWQLSSRPVPLTPVILGLGAAEQGSTGSG